METTISPRHLLAKRASDTELLRRIAEERLTSRTFPAAAELRRRGWTNTSIAEYLDRF